MTTKKNIKNILITGASKGIGKAIHKVLVSQNYNCITPSRKELDISNPESIKHFFKHSNLEIDALVNNAGINIIGTIDSLADEDIHSMINTNLIAPLLLMQYVSKNMKNNRYGKIVNISSIWGVRSKEERTLYSATKFALNGMTKSLARELGPYNILVNSVAPGYVNTKMTQANVPQEEQDKIKQTIPLRRFAQPDEIAKLVVFLISENNSYITGQTIIADGGYLA